MMQKIIWQFRLAKAGRSVRALEFSRTSLVPDSVDKNAARQASSSTSRKRAPKNASRGGAGRGKSSSQGERSWPGSWASADGNHGPSTRRIFCSDAAPRAACVARGSGWRRYRHQPMPAPLPSSPGQAALATLPWPLRLARPPWTSRHALRSHPSAVATGSHRARARFPSTLREHRPSGRA
jgi:hypothetical protein